MCKHDAGGLILTLFLNTHSFKNFAFRAYNYITLNDMNGRKVCTRDCFKYLAVDNYLKL